jgi:hypothetical protein
MAVGVPESSSESAQSNPQGGKPKKLVDRIDDSFDDTDQDQMLKYMEWLRSAILEHHNSIRRSVTLMLVLIAIFELVADSRNATLTIGSFHVSKGSIPLLFLPAVVSFLYYQLVLDSCHAARQHTAFGFVFDLWAPKAGENCLPLVLRIPEPAYWNALGADSSTDFQDAFDKEEYRSSAIFIVLIILGVYVFVGQAYYVLIPAHIPTIVAWGVSLSISIYLVIDATLLLLLAASRGDDSLREEDDSSAEDNVLSVGSTGNES